MPKRKATWARCLILVLTQALGALVSISVDIDAVAGWLGSYGGQDSTSDISRGIFAGTIGVRRLLKLFAKHNIITTWFIPGHSLESFPEECGMIRDAGHEIGLHGYSHENPVEMTLEQQTAVLDKSYKLITEFCGGKPPRGMVAPWWESSKEGAELTLKYGIEYEHNFSHHDCKFTSFRPLAQELTLNIKVKHTGSESQTNGRQSTTRKMQRLG
jgi:peptidoglycan/xylan/chitin deacetylase (PgdA/CDA1 family)